MKKNLLIAITFFAFLTSCSKVATINMKPHNFAKKPQKIIWLQIAGFHADHFALLKYRLKDESLILPSNDMTCLGNTWEYSTTEVFPNTASAQFTQFTGRMTYQNRCEDLEERSVWDYLAIGGFQFGYFSFPMKRDQLSKRVRSCPDQKFWGEKTVQWVMGKGPKGAEFFHAERESRFEMGKTYYDLSCQRGKCLSGLPRSVKKVFDTYRLNNDRFLFLVNDTQYLDLLKMDDKELLIEKLSEIQALISYFKEYQQRNSNVLFILSSVAPRSISLPETEREWRRFNKSRFSFKPLRRMGMGTVYADGAGAENFCGTYRASGILKRILWSSEDRAILKQL